MSKHSRARSRVGVTRRVLLFVLGAGAGAVAWLYLVGSAARFGAIALAGDGAAWAFTVAASVGAAVSLLLVISLMARALRVLGVVRDNAPRRRMEPPRRRAG